MILHGSVYWRIDHAQMCECRRPVGSGRVYGSHHACRGCGALIPSRALRGVLVAEREASERREREAERKRVVGGLAPETAA